MVSKILSLYYLRQCLRYFQENSLARIFTATAMVALFLLVGWGVYFLAYRGFEFTQVEEFIANVAPLYIYEVFILITGFLIFASAVISAIFVFFRRQDRDAWIASTPSYQSLAWHGFVKVVAEASWPFILIALPILLAANSFFEISVTGFLLSFLAMFIFSMFCASFGVLIVFISAYAASYFGPRASRFNILVLSAVIITFIIGYTAWHGLTSAELTDLFHIDDMTLAAATSERIIDNFRYFPSHMPALVLHNAQVGDISSSAFYFAGTLLLFLLTVFAYALAQTKFLKLWQIFAESGFEARRITPQETKSGAIYTLTSNLVNSAKLNNPSRALFFKEFLSNIRTTKIVLWAGFLTLLMLLNIFLVSAMGDRLGSRSAGNLETIAHVIPALQFAVILFFIGSFSLRFIFPSFSQEGRALWILGSAPINLRHLFFQKLKFYLFLSAVISGLASMLFFARSADILSDPVFTALPVNFSWLVFFPSILLFSLAIATTGLSLGVMFVNFKIEDPQLMGTSLPGMFLVLVFLTLGFLGGASMYQFILGTYAYLILLSLIAPAMAVIAVFYALKKLEEIEFA